MLCGKTSCPIMDRPITSSPTRSISWSIFSEFTLIAWAVSFAAPRAAFFFRPSGLPTGASLLSSSTDTSSSSTNRFTRRSREPWYTRLRMRRSAAGRARFGR